MNPPDKHGSLYESLCRALFGESMLVWGHEELPFHTSMFGPAALGRGSGSDNGRALAFSRFEGA